MPGPEREGRNSLLTQYICPVVDGHALLLDHPERLIEDGLARLSVVDNLHYALGMGEQVSERSMSGYLPDYKLAERRLKINTRASQEPRTQFIQFLSTARPILHSSRLGYVGLWLVIFSCTS